MPYPTPVAKKSLNALVATALVVPGLLIAAAAAATEAAPALPDTSKWPCKYCKFESGQSGVLEGGFGYVSDASFRFGDVTGLEDEGLFFNGGGSWRYRGEDSRAAWDLEATNLGLDSRAISFGGGQQGVYALALAYQSLPRRIAGDTRTPFLGAGASTLSLPANWDRAGSTQGMSELQNSLGTSGLQHKRERLALGAALTPAHGADYRFAYRHDRTRGVHALGGSFVTLSAQLPRPVDQDQDRFDISAGYARETWSGKLALSSEFFSNHNDALVWDNPYNAPSPGADSGRLALAPDNQAHRLSLSLGFHPGQQFYSRLHLAAGRMLQNESFLPATINPQLATALPRDSLDGRIDTRLADLRVGFTPWRALRLNAEYLFDERDNRTPVAAYTQVVSDSFVSDTRSNVPYSFERERWRISADARGPARLRIAVGYEDDTRERTLQQRSQTTEETLWARFGIRVPHGGNLRLRLSQAERDGSPVSVVPQIDPQNPLLRAFHLADRQRKQARLDYTMSPVDMLSFGLNLAYADDEYPQTALGLIGRRSLSYGADLTLIPVELLSLSLYASQQERDADQLGSENFSGPDWLAVNEDVATTAGIVFERKDLFAGFDLGAEYLYSDSDGDIRLTRNGAVQPFPVLVTRLHEARLFGSYALLPQLSLRLDLRYENYDAQDWALDGVGPDTISNVLALGQGSQGYEVGVIVLSLAYRFEQAQAAEDE